MNANYTNVPSTSNDLTKDRWRQALSASAVFWLTVCFFGPLFMQLSQNTIPILTWSITFLCISSALVVATAFLLKQLAHTRVFSPLTALIITLGILAYVQAFLVPYPYGQLHGKPIDWNMFLSFKVGSALLWLAGLSAGLFFSRYVVKHCFAIACVFIIYQVLMVTSWYMFGPAWVQPGQYRLTPEKLNSFSKTRNILILVLDGFPTSDFSKMILDNTKFSDCFEGFTFFTDSVGGYCTTRAAVPHILTGLFPDNSVPFQTFLDKNLPTESIPGILKKASYRTEAYCSGKQNALEFVFPINTPILDNTKSGIPDFFLDAEQIVSGLTEFAIKCSPDLMKQKIIHFYYSYSKIGASGAYYDLSRIERLEKLGIADTSQPVFKYEHFEGVHPPYCLTESMEIRAIDSGSEARREQVLGEIGLCCRYLKVLKNLRIYDESMIFVIADHGQGMDAPFPLFLWKPFNAKQPLNSSSVPVAQADIIATICHELRIPLDRQYALPLGRPENEKGFRERRYLAYRWDQEDWLTKYLPELTEYIVCGPSSDPSSLRPTFRVFKAGNMDVAPQLELGSTLRFKLEGNYASYIGGGWSGGEQEHVWNDGKEAYLWLPLRSIKPTHKIAIKCFPFVHPPNVVEQEVRITANGISLYNQKLTREEEITFRVPPQAFVDNLLWLRFDFPNAISISSVDRSLAVALKSLTVSPNQESPLGRLVELNNNSSEEYLGPGWGGMENWGRWTVEAEAGIEFGLTNYSSEQLYELLLDGQMFSPSGLEPRQSVTVKLNGNVLKVLTPDDMKALISIRFNGHILRDDNTLTFQVANPVSPNELGLSNDWRKLGLGLKSWMLKQLEATGSSDSLGQKAAEKVSIGTEWLSGFFQEEKQGDAKWRWCSSFGELRLRNSSSHNRYVTINMTLRTGSSAFCKIRINSPLWTENFGVNDVGLQVSRALTIPPGLHIIRFETDAVQVNAQRDLRSLYFAVYNFELVDRDL